MRRARFTMRSSAAETVQMRNSDSTRLDTGVQSLEHGEIAFDRFNVGRQVERQVNPPGGDRPRGERAQMRKPTLSPGRGSTEIRRGGRSTRHVQRAIHASGEKSTRRDIGL